MQFTVPLSTPGSVQVSQITETIGAGATFCQVVSIPNSATALQLYAGLVSGSSVQLTAQVIGEQSATNYSDGFETVPNAGLTVPINTGIDSTFQICWRNPGISGRWVLTVAALLSAVGAGTSVTVNCCETPGGGAVSDLYRFTTGLWYPAAFLDPSDAAITNNPGNDNSQYYPFPIDVPHNGFSKVGIHIYGAGAVGDKYEVGVYADTGNGAPGVLIADWGSLDASVMGDSTLAISWDPAPGLYWLAILQLTTGNPQIGLLTGAGWPYGLTGPRFTTGAYGYFINGISALPANASAAALNTNQGGAYSPFLQAA